MDRRRVAVTRLGLVSPYGADDSAAQFFDQLLRGTSAVRAWRPDPSFLDSDLPVVRCAAFDARALLGAAAAHTMDRATQLACAAASTAWRDAQLPARWTTRRAARCAGARAWAASTRSRLPTTT
jgi:3-oxoacyl-(acyl-carrier-protein) synthase